MNQKLDESRFTVAKQNGLYHECYYYLRKEKIALDKNNVIKNYSYHRCGIVYLMYDGIYTARGISLCNKREDTFMRDAGMMLDKEVSNAIGKKVFNFFEGGLKKARDRAMKAIKTKKSSEKIKIDTAKAKIGDFNFTFKSEITPNLLPFEEAILFTKRR